MRTGRRLYKSEVFQTQWLGTCKVVFALSGVTQEAALVNNVFDHFLPISALSSLFGFAYMAVWTSTWLNRFTNVS